jgi:phage-related protein
MTVRSIVEILYHIRYNQDMANRIIFYEKEDGEKPVEDFINSLPLKHKAKVYWEIEMLERFGKNLKEPYVKPIAGDKYKGLWELRIKFAGDISRIFYFVPVRNDFVLLHGFIKKSQATPERELLTAMSRMSEFERRMRNENLERS